MKPFWGFVTGLAMGIAFTTFYFLRKKAVESGSNRAVKATIIADKPTEK